MSGKLEENKDSNSFTIDMVQKIIDYIEESLLEELTPKIIADRFFMSISAISNLFKIVCNMTIMEYVRYRRLTLAGQELLTTNTRIIEIAYKYGYETPEAFAKAFTRFHGFPPSMIRRTYPKITVFNKIHIKLVIEGGWDSILTDEHLSYQTKDCYIEQEKCRSFRYDRTTKFKGGLSMDRERYKYQICVDNMRYKDDWRILLLLAKGLEEAGINFKVDGKTMIFAHGLEFKLEKICLTFKWDEEQKILNFFGSTDMAKSTYEGFKYFDTVFEGMKIRCMFFGECQGDDTDEFLYRNAEPVYVDGQIIYVQTLEFYVENAEPDNEYYKMVEDFLKLRG